MGKAMSKKLPSNKDAEQSVLGSMMMSSDAISKVFSRTTRPDIFWYKEHRLVFKSMLELFTLGIEIDQITVCDRLKKNGDLEKVGGSYYVTGLLEVTPAPSTVLRHLDIVIDKRGLRKLIKDGKITEIEAYDESLSTMEILKSSGLRLLNLEDELNGHPEIVRIGDNIHEDVRRIEEENARARDSGVFGISSGFIDLDILTHGIETEYTIIAGRPSMGKTALALGIAYNVAIQGIPVYLISLEMSKDNLIKRMIYSLGCTSRQDVLDGIEGEKVNAGAAKISEVPIYLDENPRLDVVELRSRVRQQIVKNEIGLVIIDYLQLMVSVNDNRWESKNQEVSEISRGIANLKKETNIPFIVLSQLNRKLEQRKDKRPLMSDLRESGSLEQDADKVILMYRKSYYDNDAIDDSCEIIVAKNRNGPTGSTYLKFQKEYARFDNLPSDESDANIEKANRDAG